jgi:hypothetical protein
MMTNAVATEADSKYGSMVPIRPLMLHRKYSRNKKHHQWSLHVLV